MPSTSHAIAADQISYADLYARWEQGNWRATEIDFTRDREDWLERFTEMDRRSALWTYSLFFHGEDSVADNLSPFIDAAPREDQKYFLATQQVDEARHAVLFARFLREVAGAGADIGSSLDETRPGLTWGFRKVFDRLDRMTAELRRDHSKPKLAQAITLYLAHRLEEVDNTPEHILLHAARAEFDGKPPANVTDWLADQGVTLN